ncbi:phosphoglucosamine mutase, partial [Roseomonas sp. DSM 102946]|nr:phosphoglucosamine mutase [Roseomonas sp. DSM 102946]
TGDGLVAALQVLAAIVEEKRPASAVCRRFEPLPQKLVNLRHSGGDPLTNPLVIEAIRAAEADLGARGRLLIRPSGTEPLIRVMVEAEEASMVERLTSELAETIRAVAATPERKPGTKSSRQEAAE